MPKKKKSNGKEQGPTPINGPPVDVPEENIPPHLRPRICPLLSIGQLIAGQVTFLQQVTWAQEERAGKPKIALADEKGKPRNVETNPTKINVPDPFCICLREKCRMWAGPPDVGECALRNDIMVAYREQGEEAEKPDAEDEGENGPN